jgi:hypothetical protein
MPEAAYPSGPGQGWTGVTFSNLLYVAVSNSTDAKFAVSSNGINWTATNAPAVLSWSDVQGGGTGSGTPLFVAIAEPTGGNTTNYYATSTDGTNWIGRTLPVSSQWGSVAWGYYNTNRWVILRRSSSVHTLALASQSGTGTWTQITLPVSARWQKVIYASSNTSTSQFVAIANEGHVARSLDGVTWSSTRISTADITWGAIGFNSITNTYVAISYNSYGNNFSNTIATSTDAINWTMREVPISARWRVINSNLDNNKFYVLSDSGGTNPVLTSTDGINWSAEQLNTGVRKYWRDIACYDGRCVAVGAGWQGLSYLPPNINQYRQQ